MSFFLFPVLVFLVGGILVKISLKSASVYERRLLWLSYCCHLLAVVAGELVATYYYGGGDRTVYHRIGGVIATYMHQDFANIAPRLLSLLLQQGGDELVPYGAGTPTGSMQAVAGLLHFVTGGSLPAACGIISVCSFFAKLSIYRVFKRHLHQQYWRAALLGTMLVPSVLYWSSGLLKESVAISFLGLMVVGTQALIDRRRIRGTLLVVIGIVGVSLFKPYLLIPFTVGAGAWFYVFQSRKQVLSSAKPLKVTLAIVGVFAMLLAISSFFPRYDLSSIQQQVLEQQDRGSRQTDAGSHFSLESQQSRSTIAVLLVAPWAVFTGLLRPVIVEARNPLALANGIETLIMTIMLGLVLFRRGLRRSAQEIRLSPILSFCLVFSVLLAAGVGYSSTNLGSLSRYRMPLVPFFVVLLAVLSRKRAQSPRHRREKTNSG